MLSRITEQTGFQPTDISVPFEKQNLAFEWLQLLADVITNKQQGLYIMRYHDDSLTTRLYVLLVSDSQATFSVLAAVAGSLTRSSRYRVNSAAYDPVSSSLQLSTDAGDIDLTPADITPVGAWSFSKEFKAAGYYISKIHPAIYGQDALIGTTSSTALQGSDLDNILKQTE